MITQKKMEKKDIVQSAAYHEQNSRKINPFFSYHPFKGIPNL
jgi:hypothetical protein